MIHFIDFLNNPFTMMVKGVRLQKSERFSYLSDENSPHYYLRTLNDCYPFTLIGNGYVYDLR